MNINIAVNLLHVIFSDQQRKARVACDQVVIAEYKFLYRPFVENGKMIFSVGQYNTPLDPEVSSLSSSTSLFRL